MDCVQRPLATAPRMGQRRFLLSSRAPSPVGTSGPRARCRTAPPGAHPQARGARRIGRCALALLLLLEWGCAAEHRPRWLHEPGWNKPWTYRSGVAAAVCAAIGAGAGVGVQQARTSCATISARPPGGTVAQSCSSLGDANDSTFWLWGALIGAAAGAALCGVLGHVFLDPPETTLSYEAPPLPPQPEPAAPPAAREAVPAAVPTKQRIVLRGVTFDFNSADIRPEARPVLDQAAAMLTDNPGVSVRVEGYTDSVGTATYNQGLSVRRAESVYRYLVNRGVDPERFTVEGFGAANPVASNATEAGRAQNRRVELIPKH
jgi:outer membrane protein OmpA-like peptidoglycan-associated protein